MIADRSQVVADALASESWASGISLVVVWVIVIAVGVVLAWARADETITRSKEVRDTDAPTEDEWWVSIR